MLKEACSTTITTKKNLPLKMLDLRFNVRGGFLIGKLQIEKEVL